MAGEPFVLFPRHKGPGLYDLIIGYCRRSGVSPDVVQEAVQMQTITALVAAGSGLAVVPSSQRAISRPGLVFRPLRNAPTVDLVAAWSDPRRTPACTRALEVLLEAGSAPHQQHESARARTNLDRSDEVGLTSRGLG